MVLREKPHLVCRKVETETPPVKGGRKTQHTLLLRVVCVQHVINEKHDDRNHKCCITSHLSNLSELQSRVQAHESGRWVMQTTNKSIPVPLEQTCT